MCNYQCIVASNAIGLDYCLLAISLAVNPPHLSPLMLSKGQMSQCQLLMTQQKQVTLTACLNIPSVADNEMLVDFSSGMVDWCGGLSSRSPP